MDQRNSRNALIACGVFFILIFIMMTVHSYGEALKSMRPQHSDSDIYEDILLRKPKKYGPNEEGTQKINCALTVIVPKYNNSVVNKTTLGNYAWTVLHLMSLRYPEYPTQMDQRKMSIFLHLL
jgi:Mitochondrial sulfhydryl oxidase involved in the biogenesis of cytosolic Fe/S proteins